MPQEVAATQELKDTLTEEQYKQAIKFNMVRTLCANPNGWITNLMTNDERINLYDTKGRNPFSTALLFENIDFLLASSANDGANARLNPDQVARMRSLNMHPTKITAQAAAMELFEYMGIRLPEGHNFASMDAAISYII